MRRPRNTRYNQIGIDRILRLEWLERVARLVLTGNEASDVKAELQKYLSPTFQVSTDTTRSSLDKTITILMRTWLHPPPELHSLHQEGLMLLSILPEENHMEIHWGMLMAVYPFWGAVANHVGRLIRLQEAITAKQVQRRIQEHYGERETVYRATQRILRSFIYWGVLKEASVRGSYVQGAAHTITREDIIAWLAEAFLYAHSGDSVIMRAFFDSTNLFPFCIQPISATQLSSISDRLCVFRQGRTGEELITLKKR